MTNDKKEPIEEPGGVVPGWALFSTRVLGRGPDWIPGEVVGGRCKVDRLSVYRFYGRMQYKK